MHICATIQQPDNKINKQDGGKHENIQSKSVR